MCCSYYIIKYRKNQINFIMLNKLILAVFCITVYLCLVSSENELETTEKDFTRNVILSKENELLPKVKNFTPKNFSEYEQDSNAAKILETCNETQTCDNGGSCLNHVCVCLPGTSGPFCKTITDCQTKRFCIPNDRTRCLYNVEQQKAICDCNTMEDRFDELSRTCRSCKCSDSWVGPPYYDFTYCEYRLGKRVCVCADDYVYNPHSKTCKTCSCGENSDWCGFDEDGNTVCGCKEGFMQSYSRCLECTCGKHGTCSTTDGRDYYGSCDCDPGYTEHYPGSGYHSNICLECSCGKHGKCIFDKNNTFVGCKCDEGYQEKIGVCEMCYCGDNSNCSFSGNRKICSCAKGFEDINGFCTDINECVKHNPCKKSTKCINILGGFKCVCDDGYTLVDPYSEAHFEICQDVDECKNSTACAQPNTECVNTPGSYECICQSDYIFRGGSGTVVQCEKSSSSSIYTVLICTSLAVLVLTVMAEVYAKRNLQRRN